MTKGLSAIVMAAGQGTRMKSELPKVLHPLLGRTLLSHAMHAVMGLEPESLVVVVRHDRDRVEAEALRVYPEAIIADQDEVPGTGRAVQCGLEGAALAGADLHGTILVTNADVPLLETDTLQALVEAHEEAGAAVTAMTAIVADATGYGRMLRTGGPNGPLSGIVEHRDATEEQLQILEINAGIYAFDANFLKEALGQIGSDNDQGEVYLTDTIELATRAGLLAQAFVLEDIWQAEGCNDRAQLSDLRDELLSRVCRAHQIAGVSIVDPSATSIDVEVVLGQDAVIEPFTALVGDTTIGPRTVVGSGSVVVNSHVGADAVIKSSYLEDSVVDSGVVLNPNTVLQADSTSSSEGNAR